MTERKKIDWERIEIDYRSGVKTLRQIAEENGITHGAVNKRAKRDGWVRDLSEKIKGKVTLPPADPMETAGFLYVIYLDDTAEKRFYKIGLASSFTARFNEHKCASPFDICVACAYYTGNMRTEERYLHKVFAGKKVKGEWFSLDTDDLKFIANRSLLI